MCFAVRVCAWSGRCAGKTHDGRERRSGDVGLFKKRLVVSYTPGDAWTGEISTLLKSGQHEKIVDAMKLGKQFAKDFAFFHPFNEPHNEEFDADLLKALLVVQQLGKLYEPKCMN